MNTDTKDTGVQQLKQAEPSTEPETEQPETGQKDDPVIDEAWLAREKRLRRKLDCTLMPIIWILYLFNYLDRNNIAQAKLDTFEADLGLKGNNFNTAVSILNVGYMLMQVPSNMLLTRVRPSLFIPFWVCAWSCISAATAGVNNYPGLIAVRFFLGVSEAPFGPGAFFLLSCWYTKKELALRTAVLYSGLVLATSFGGLLSAAIFAGLSGVHGVAGWRWLFIIEGAASFGFGLIAFFLIPDYPESNSGLAKWLLTKEEREVAVERIARDQVSNQESNDSIWYGLKAAVMDYRVWVFAFILCCNHTAYGFNNFYPTIVQGFKLGSRTVTLLCTAPPYLVGAVISLLIAYSSDIRSERGWHIGVPMAMAASGFIISVATLNVPARYFASFLYISGCFSGNAILFGWAASSVSQTPKKRACATAIINVMGQFGNIWSPYFFSPGDSPRYVKAMILMVTFSMLSILGCMFMKWTLNRDNKKLLERFAGTGRAPNLYTL
ncbi:major facilitator superfamily transporter [Colletotrichum karsti]|uniref:Major facilitator superfamily transporter n=1 Tax=Colletotrichum karsti TaxID=1095194 RepID=A0A9P6IB68_9PEZI|nr:major facilitator superfamily transporter [Colletotrichum karsti]KAF9880197.1 major facilitator superfamily transporter [Colletotrichum karsti]